MSNDNIKQVSLPTYLEVLAKLPGVIPADVQTAEQALQQVFGDSYSQAVEFNRGLKYGDGKIQATALFRSEGGASIATQVVISQEGSVQNSAAGLSENVSPLFTRYFIGTLFGAEELTESVRGAQKLYSLEQERDYNLKASELIWTWAEQAREAAVGLGDGDPDDIQEIMNRYKIFQNWEESGDAVNNAWIRAKRAREMIGEVRQYVADHKSHESVVHNRLCEDCGIGFGLAGAAADSRADREMYGRTTGTGRSNSDKEPVCHGRGCY